MLGLAALLFIGANLFLFRTPFYRNLLAPDSSAGSFEATVERLRALPAGPQHDVLVLGDSRIYNGLDTAVAGASAGGLRFINAAVPGTTPRDWPYLLRAIDPTGKRYRAIVLPVDTYGDDDSAIGSLDGAARLYDLRYIVFETGLADLGPLANSFPDPRSRLEVALDLALRGPVLRDDVQDFLADPAGRIALVAATPPPAGAQHPRRESLAGLGVDFARGAITYPPAVAPDERAAIADQVLRVSQPSPSYGAYRARWLGEIVARYRAAGVPVVVVRIPARPAHRALPAAPTGSLPALASGGGVTLVRQAPYVALERPELFADHDHLNAAGSLRFSRLLGADVAAALAAPPAVAAVPARPAPPVAAPQASAVSGAAPAAESPLRAALHATLAALGIGTPLLFQSFEFWFFFALVAAGFYAARGARRGPAGKLALLAASYYFYARWNATYIFFLFALSASDYAIGRALEREGRARFALLSAGVAANVAFLGTLKYADFASGTLAALLGLPADPWTVHWLVPIGISFHTFQSISYLVDVYRRRTQAVRDPLDYALYIAFFPQLLAGPIVRAARFFGELAGWRTPTAAEVARGAGEIVVGLVKKTAIADQFAVVSDAYWSAPAAHPGAPAAWSAALAFALQIYFDFSGYSDIAIGTARLLGFAFPENFRRPYFASSISDFWRRWHISLSTWLRDYLYIPLGGNRHGRARTYLNLMITMLLGGLWHGANWTFVAWGGYYGALLSLERAAGVGRREAARANASTGVARVAFTFTLVLLGWVLFRAPSFGAAFDVYRALFAGGSGPWLLVPWELALAALAFACEFAAERGRTPVDWWTIPVVRGGAALAALGLVLELLSYPGTATPFIYFKF
jgi:alginate O-acetyltransferase complex protein AlgI